ncbi:right-handed parallel beta-helix repeat-containing protein [Phycicoccus avicenniae]|uniref:right-handed parallel beta-helix repeat-containing protein n=1 Tax=Phycicoccus avicenniae TaxID=2828860 RepID=UPI003D2A9E14
MSTYTFKPVPVWGSPGQFGRIGAARSRTFPVTTIAGATATVVQGGTTKAGYIESDANGLIPAFTTTDIPSVQVDFGIGTVVIHSLEAITAGASSAAAASSSATDAANSATAAAAAASSATVSAGNKVDKGALIFNASDYGVTGDGATDDTTAIQSLLTAARAAKARIKFGFGKTHIVSATLNPAGVVIEGNSSTLKVKDGLSATLNVLQSAAPFSATGLTIDLNKANTLAPGADTQGVGIYLAVTSTGWTGKAVLRDIRIVNGHQVGLRVSSSTTVTDAETVTAFTRTVLDSVVVENCKWGIWVKGVRGVTLIDPHVTGCASDGIYDYASRDTFVQGGLVDTAGGHGFVSQYGHATKVDGLSALGCAGSGIAFGGGSTTITEGRDFTIKGCTAIGNTGHGITLDPTKTGAGAAPVAVGASVTGNVCKGNGIHGIYLNNAKGVAITGNTCRGNTNAGIGIAGYQTAIGANVCTGNARGIAFYGNASFPNYGQHRVAPNVVTDNSTSSYYVESASVTAQFASVSATPPE